MPVEAPTLRRHAQKFYESAAFLLGPESKLEFGTGFRMRLTAAD